MIAIPDDIFEKCQDPSEVLFLLYIATHADEEGRTDLSVRSVAKAINIDRNKAQKLAQKLAQKSTLKSSGKANKTALTLCSNDIFRFDKSQLKSQLSDDDKAFEKIWKEYGRIGSKKLAKQRFNKLSNVKKEALAKSIPYYKTFHDPNYFVHLSTYISEEVWNNIERYEGVQIPKENYRVANVEKFISWFNGCVQGKGIPQISELTPARCRMLNICYTLCYEEMKKVMDILLLNEKYIDMAKKGMIDFDYIFKPANLRKIYEYGTTKQTTAAERQTEHAVDIAL